MRVLAIVHQSDSGPGVFLDAIAAARAELHTWVPALEPSAPSAAEAYDAILTFGGSAHPVQDDVYPWLTVEKRFLAQAIRARVPLFGVCLDSQLIAEAVGTHARRCARPEIGWFEAWLTDDAATDPVVGPLAGRFQALQWHSYEVPLPAGATALAYSDACLQSYRIDDRIWGVQFHPEVTGEDFQHWLEVDGADEDAVGMGLDVSAVAAQTRERIESWNRLGHGLCERFLRVASQL